VQAYIRRSAAPFPLGDLRPYVSRLYVLRPYVLWRCVLHHLRRQAKIKAAQTGQTMASVLRECLRKWAEEPVPEPEKLEEDGEKETQDS